MLDENCPVATPTTEDSSMSLAEQSDTPGENVVPAQPESSVETQPSVESRQTSFPTREGVREGDSSLTSNSGSDSYSGSNSEPGDESGSDSESSAGSNVPLLSGICLLFRGLRLIRGRVLKSWG